MSGGRHLFSIVLVRFPSAMKHATTVEICMRRPDVVTAIALHAGPGCDWEFLIALSKKPGRMHKPSDSTKP